MDRVASDPSGLVRDVWTVLLDQMKRRAEARQRFASHLNDEMKQRLEVLERETATSSKRCLEFGTSLQLEMQRSYKSVDDALKTYHQAQGTEATTASSLAKLGKASCLCPPFFFPSWQPSAAALKKSWAKPKIRAT